MPLPPAAERARAAAVAQQSRRNGVGALLATGFVVGVFYYCVSAVGQNDEITERELAQFRRERDRQQAQQAAEAASRQ